MSDDSQLYIKCRCRGLNKSCTKCDGIGFLQFYSKYEDELMQNEQHIADIHHDMLVHKISIELAKGNES